MAIKLGSHRKWKGHGRKRKYQEIDESMMYIPLQPTLLSMLEDNTMLKEVCMHVHTLTHKLMMCVQVMNPHTNSTGTIATFRDGRMLARNELFASCPKALQINLYYDDVEVCNPLGSKRKIHKLGKIHTFSFLNLSPL